MTLRLSPLDMNKNELQNAVVQNLASAPGTPAEGQIYHDTVSHAPFYRSNSAWVSMSPLSLLSLANTWTNSNVFNGAITGNNTINLTGTGASSVGGVFTATAHGAVGLTGAVTATRYVGGTASGAPGSGTFITGDFIVTTGGDIWVCTAGGTPGTWSRVGSYLLGTANTWTSTNVFNGAITGNNTINLTGTSASSVGGTMGATTFIPSGLTGATGASRYVGATSSGAPGSGTFVQGDYVIDRTGSIWICTTGGSPGTWTQVGSAGTVYNQNIQANGGASVTQRNIINFINGTYTTATAVDNTTKTDVKFDVTTATPSGAHTFGGANAPGSATSLVRSDHVHALPAHDAAAHSAIKISDLAAPAANVAFATFKITGLGDPTAAQDAATKNYVDLARQGLELKDSVAAATTGVLPNTPTYSNGTAGVGATLTASSNVAFPGTLDGVTTASGARYLVKDQASGLQNGIYTLTAVGSGAAPWVLTRAVDNDSSTSTPPRMTAGTMVYVDGGAVNGGQTWAMNQTAAITMGTTAITWAQISGASTTTAGAGLTATGNVFAVGAGTGISVAADSVAVDTAVVVRKYAVDVGNGSLTTITVTHNLGTLDVTVAVYTNSGGAEVECDVVHATTNTVTLTFTVAPTSAQYRCVVHG